MFTYMSDFISGLHNHAQWSAGFCTSVAESCSSQAPDGPVNPAVLPGGFPLALGQPVLLASPVTFDTKRPACSLALPSLRGGCRGSLAGGRLALCREGHGAAFSIPGPSCAFAPEREGSLCWCCCAPECCLLGQAFTGGLSACLSGGLDWRGGRAAVSAQPCFCPEPLNAKSLCFAFQNIAGPDPPEVREGTSAPPR